VTAQSQLAAQATEAKLSHEQFMAAWREGEIRIHVDPAAAATLVSARLLLPYVGMAIIGLGIALVLWQWLWTGLAVGAFGILGPRLIKRSAAGFLLERIPDDPALYEAALDWRALSYARRDPPS
jgi:hypothetical protein